MSIKLEWFPIHTLDEATDNECFNGLWFYDTDGGVFSFAPFIKGYWHPCGTVTHWAYGDKPNKPAAKARAERAKGEGA